MTALLLSPPRVVALLPPRPHRRALRCVAMASQPRVAVDQLPHTITSHYLAVQNPQQYRKTYTSAVKAFVRAAVLAYECGYSEDTLRRHLQQQQSGQDMALEQRPALDGNDDDDALDEDTVLCMRCITLVWVTCQLSPVGVRRWCAGRWCWWRHDVGNETLLMKAYTCMLFRHTCFGGDIELLAQLCGHDSQRTRLM